MPHTVLKLKTVFWLKLYGLRNFYDPHKWNVYCLLTSSIWSFCSLVSSQIPGLWVSDTSQLENVRANSFNGKWLRTIVSISLSSSSCSRITDCLRDRHSKFDFSIPPMRRRLIAVIPPYVSSMQQGRDNFRSDFRSDMGPLENLQSFTQKTIHSRLLMFHPL